MSANREGLQEGGSPDLVEKILTWTAKATSLAFFWFFALTGAFLFVLSVVRATSAVSSIGEVAVHPEELLLGGLGLATIAAASLELGFVFSSLIRHTFSPRTPSGHRVIRYEIATFIRVAVIAVAVEGLVLLFEGVRSERELLPLAALVIGVSALLMVGLGLFHYLTRE